MPNKVVHFKSIGPVTFFRNRRSKNMKISVKPDKSVLVSFPFFISDKEILSFLAKHEAWIRNQQAKINTGRKALTEGTILNTKLHSVELVSSVAHKIESHGSTIKFHSPDFDDENVQSAIHKLLTKVYRVEALVILPPRLKKLAQVHGFSYAKVSIRNNKRNWGSCSSKNNISLNLQMMKLPDELIDYILLHELVHTEIKDHSERFWKRLDLLTQNRARDLAKKVKKYSTSSL
jgi:predicted metal-dependent hydrolase